MTQITAKGPSQMAWYLAQLKPNSARIAERNLKRQNFETFLPMEEVTKRTREKFSTLTRPLFPGYIFVALDKAAGRWRSVNATQGITRLVSFGSDPAQVPDAIMTQLMQDAEPQAETETFLPGDSVRVLSGPFTDFVAQIQGIAPEQRVWALMEIMGQQTRVALRADQLRAV
jgi:transcriptional antiterminator RfaH